MSFVFPSMKRRTTILILVVCLGGLVLYFRSGKPPSIPTTSRAVTISLSEPFTRELIVERTITDQQVIQSMSRTFARARMCRDHKCASIGTITFVLEGGLVALDVLPGHDASHYEFRLDGHIYRLPREVYIGSLVAAGIDPADIRLEEHPDRDKSRAPDS